jgi:hypothetical protein
MVTDYTAPGTYTFTTTNSAGCDSVATLNLAVNATTTSTTDVTYVPLNCLITGMVLTILHLGLIRSLQAIRQGVIRLRHWTWQSIQRHTSTTDVTICPTNYLITGTVLTIRSAGTFTFTTTNAAGCDSVATLNLAVNSTTTSTTDVTICPNQLPYNWNGTDYTIAGTYTFTTTNAAGCDSVATLNLAVNSTTTSTTDVTICPAQLPYNWNGTDYTIAGTYTFTTTNSAGCDSVATLNLAVNSTTTSTTDVTICPNQYLITGMVLTIR